VERKIVKIVGSNLKGRNEKGQILAEILVAVVLAGIIIGGISATTGTSIITGSKIRETTSAVSFIQELMEGVKSISESSWLTLYCPPSGSCPGNKGSPNHYYLNYVGGMWQVQSGEKNISVEGVNYSYYFYIENVNRDSSGNIISSGGTEDPSTQKITIVANWPPNSSISMSEYLMRTSSSHFSDYNWDIERISEGIFTNSQGYYATTSGPLTMQNGTISLTPSDSGSLTSPIFDTGFINGVAFNGIRWKGSMPASSHVRIQLATSNATTSWNFIGPDGTSATYYEAAGPDQIIPISLLYHNNHRYFRYKIYLDPTTDYTNAPAVYKVIFTYSP